MAIIQSGATADLLTVDPIHKAARATTRPVEHGAFGHYRYASKSGTIGAALAAGGLVFAFRYGSATSVAVVTSLKVRCQGNVAFTAAAANLSLAAYIGRSYTASHTGGTAATSTGNNLKLRSSFATSQINASGDIRIATTAALGGGTITLDTQSFAYGGPGRPNIVNAAAATEYLLSTPEFGRIDYQAAVGSGEHPIVLAQNEGIVIRNEVVWPAAGTAEVSVEIQWAECPAY